MSQLSLGFQALHMCSHSMDALERAVDCRADMRSVWVIQHANQVPVRGTARRPHFSLAFISVTVQLRIYVFLVISVYFNLRNILPKSGTFLPGHPVYIYIFFAIWYAGQFSLWTSQRLWNRYFCPMCLEYTDTLKTLMVMPREYRNVWYVVLCHKFTYMYI